MNVDAYRRLITAPPPPLLRMPPDARLRRRPASRRHAARAPHPIPLQETAQ